MVYRFAIWWLLDNLDKYLLIGAHPIALSFQVLAAI